MQRHECVDICVLGIVRCVIIYYRASRPLGSVFVLNKRIEYTKNRRSTCLHKDMKRKAKAAVAKAKNEAYKVVGQDGNKGRLADGLQGGKTKDKIKKIPWGGECD